ncbi:MAG: methionine--tRNA ligase [Parcubacteria group bacterium]
MSRKSFYITTTLPYVNAEPHIGFAMELIHADIIARAKKLQGFDVFFNTGTDEHGAKVFGVAQKEGKDLQKYTDELSEKFRNLKNILGLSEDIHFIRTTEERHKKAAQEMWQRCQKAGYIDKKLYKIKYCVGCELEKTDSELADDKCPIHPTRDLEIHEEENYFFKFSEFGPKLLELYEERLKVTPDHRLNEIKALIERGLEDFSISRLKNKMPWGVSVPGDPDHVMYVWFDALVSYISTLGWPDDTETFDKFWVNGRPTQFAGKDQVRQQAAMWQAMLIAADLPPTREIVIHGFINYEGQKMSKSIGNVISPQEVISRFNLDTLRYFVARELNQFEDTDVSREKIKTAYNANLANGLGNLTARIMKLAESNLPGPVSVKSSAFDKEAEMLLDKFEIQKAINHIWNEIGNLDALIQEKKPWESKDKGVITDLVLKLSHIAHTLSPFMPETSKKILAAIMENKMPKSLFLRKD